MSDSIRKPRQMKYGRLSVQASEWHYCSPLVSGLPLYKYDTVEVAVWSRNGAMTVPSKLVNRWFHPIAYRRLRKFDHLWEHDTVAAYVSQEDIKALREAMS